MAAMNDTQRSEVWADFMQQLSNEHDTMTSLVKADIRAAVDAADQWASDNAGAFNTALPVAARTNLTANQKARLLTSIINKRWIVGA